MEIMEVYGSMGNVPFLGICFTSPSVHFIQDTPLTQINNLAQEASARLSVQIAKEELRA